MRTKFNIIKHFYVFLNFRERFAAGNSSFSDCHLKLFCDNALKWFYDFPKIQLPSRNINLKLHPSYQTDYPGHQNGNGIRKIDEVFIVLPFAGRRLYTQESIVLGELSGTFGALSVRARCLKSLKSSGRT